MLRGILLKRMHVDVSLETFRTLEGFWTPVVNRLLSSVHLNHNVSEPYTSDRSFTVLIVGTDNIVRGVSP